MSVVLGAERIMGPNGQAQLVVQDLGRAYGKLLSGIDTTTFQKASIVFALIPLKISERDPSCLNLTQKSMGTLRRLETFLIFKQIRDIKDFLHSGCHGGGDGSR